MVTDDSHGDKSGGDAVVFASGSAGTAAMCHWAALAVEEGGAGGANGKDHGGGHILAVNDVYGGTARMLSRTAKPLGVETTFLNFEQAGEEGIKKALRPDTRVRRSAVKLVRRALMYRSFGSSVLPTLSSWFLPFHSS